MTTNGLCTRVRVAWVFCPLFAIPTFLYSILWLVPSVLVVTLAPVLVD